MWLWRRLVRVPRAPEKAARVLNLTRRAATAWSPSASISAGVSPTRGIEWTRRVASVRHARSISGVGTWRLAEERREPVESLDRDMTTSEPTTHRRERETDSADRWGLRVG